MIRHSDRSSAHLSTCLQRWSSSLPVCLSGVWVELQQMSCCCCCCCCHVMAGYWENNGSPGGSIDPPLARSAVLCGNDKNIHHLTGRLFRHRRSTVGGGGGGVNSITRVSVLRSCSIDGLQAWAAGWETSNFDTTFSKQRFHLFISLMFHHDLQWTKGQTRHERNRNNVTREWKAA